MKNKHLSFKRTLCGTLLTSTLFTSIVPAMPVYAENEPGLGAPAHGATQETDYTGIQAGLTPDDIGRIVNDTPLTNEPWVHDLGSTGEQLIVFGSKAKTASGGSDLRYTTLSYQIEYQGIKLSISAQNLIGQKADGTVTNQYMGFTSGQIAQALYNQGPSLKSFE